ncbi:MAG: hypothetical protein ACYC5V_08285 [Gemmatimonadaceae bacterium]
MPTLAARVGALADHIFDSADLAATALDDRLRSRCLAVIVLAHAEIEETVEKACESAVVALERHGPPDLHFLAWGLSSADRAVPSDKDFERQIRAGNTITHLASVYRSVINATNGIKRRNLAKLLLPLGVDLVPLKADIDNLNSFGERRGVAAHVSPLKAQLVNAPSTVKCNVVSAAQSGDAIVSAIDAVAHLVINKTASPRPRMSLFHRLINAIREV